jgi:hypothetical protein
MAGKAFRSKEKVSWPLAAWQLLRRSFQNWLKGTPAEPLAVGEGMRDEG